MFCGEHTFSSVSNGLYAHLKFQAFLSARRQERQKLEWYSESLAPGATSAQNQNSIRPCSKQQYAKIVCVYSLAFSSIKSTVGKIR